jgi:hypothetical protein
MDEDFRIVEPVFRGIHARVWPDGADRPRALSILGEDELAIYVTRLLEGQVDNGGWYQLFGNGEDYLIEPAIAAYEHLGLPDYAEVVRAVRDAGFAEDSPEELGERLDARYFRLSGSENARADLVRDRGLEQ